MGHRFGKNEDYAIYWNTSCCDVGIRTYTLTNEMKVSLEKCLREQLPEFYFYEHFYGKIYVNKCHCDSNCEKYFKEKLSSVQFEMDFEVEYTCYCYDYGSEGMTQNITINVQF